MKVPYQLVMAVKTERRYAQMAEAIRRVPTRLRPVPIDPAARLTVACYGPSLVDTWDLIREDQRAGIPILSMSGATQFLADRGVIANWHMDMDPRAVGGGALRPIPGVHYLMASVCPPSTWDLLADAQVSLWHARTDKDTVEWVQNHDPGGLVIWTGSTVGLGALHMCGILGFRHVEIHGMDGSFALDDRMQRHAGPHCGPSQEKHRVTWDAGRVTYQTTKIMANAVAETLNVIRTFPIFCVFHGHGLTQALVREEDLPNACCADDAARAAFVREHTAAFIPLSPLAGRMPPLTSYWDTLVDALDPAELRDLLAIVAEAEPRRQQATYNTGSVPLESLLLLRAVCRQFRPKVIVEIGTFIGASTSALVAEDLLFTCDERNDCFHPSDHRIRVHPGQSSTVMLQSLVDQGLQVDLFFFDGRIRPADVPLIQALAHPETMYLFDDYSKTPGADKGVANHAALTFIDGAHLFVPPTSSLAGRSTLAMLLPMTRLQAKVA